MAVAELLLVLLVEVVGHGGRVLTIAVVRLMMDWG